MDYDAQVKEHVALLSDKIREIGVDIDTALKGKRCRIISDPNDQPHRRSTRKSLVGKVSTISRAFYNRQPWETSWGERRTGINLFLEDHTDYIDLAEVEILDPDQEA